MTQVAYAAGVGEKAPNFSLTSIKGEEIELSALTSGKLVLLDFWASWCPPCRKEAPLVQEFYEKHKDSVAVVGINMAESKKTVTNFMDTTGLSYPMAIDSGEVARNYGVVAIPTIILIAKDGKILYRGHSVHEAETKLP